MRRLIPAVALSVVFAAGCQDVVPPTAVAPGPDPRANISADRNCTANVTDPTYTAAMGTGDDWGKAIQAAVNACSNVTIPARSQPYPVYSTVRLPSNTVVTGGGRTNTILDFQNSPVSADLGPYSPLFAARGGPYSPVQNITVQHLGFRGPGTDNANRMAFLVMTGHHIKFLHNAGDGIALAYVTAHFDSIGQTDAGMAAAYAVARNGGWEGGHSYNVEIRGNRGSGWKTTNGNTVPTGEWGLSGITVAYTLDALVQHDTLMSYRDGVYLYGGPDAIGNTNSNDPRYVAQVRVLNSRADTTGLGAFWVAMGQGIHFEGNEANECYDVCFDAEGSKDVLFLGGKIRDGVRPLATYGIASNITFDGISVTQTGRDPENPHGHWLDMFAMTLRHSEQGEQSWVTIKNSTFDYQAPLSHAKASRIYTSFLHHGFRLLNNTLKNVVVDADGQGLEAGGVEVTGNNITLGYHLRVDSAAYPETGGRAAAIHVGRNHSPATVNGGNSQNVREPYRVVIENNSIRSDWRQEGYGIYVFEEKNMNVLIQGNTVQDWTGGSIAVHRIANDPRFYINSNRLSAGIKKLNNPWVSESGNTAISNSYLYVYSDPLDPGGGGGCGSQIIC